MKRTLYIIILLLTVAAWTIACDRESVLSKQKQINKDLESIVNLSMQGADSLVQKGSGELIEESIKCISRDTLIDKAKTSLNIVVNRYYSNPADTAARKYGAEAMRHLANIYMSYDIDYGKAYKHLKSAKQILDDDNDEYSLSYIYTSLINLYHMNDLSPESESYSPLQSQIDNFISEGIECSMRSGNEIALTCLVVDIPIMYESENGWGRFAPLMEKVKKYRFNSDNPYAGISKNIISGFDAYFDKDYDEAERRFLAACDSLELVRYGERFLFPIKIFLMRLYKSADLPEKELGLGKEMLTLATGKNYKDYQLWMYGVMEDLYNSRGVKDSADFYHDRYLRLQEVMRKDSGYDSVRTMDFLSEIERINSEVEMLSLKRQEQRRVQVIIISALLVLFVVLVALLWGYLNLKKNHRNLYEKSQEMIRREEQHRLLREQLAAEKAELIAKINDKDKLNNDIVPQLDNPTPPETAEEDREKQELRTVYTSILEKMEESDEIFRSGFQLDDLASLVNEQYRLVSRAINICHGSTFHQLLNEYRIREASRRMHQAESDNLTIESIADSVGFKSRTSFAAMFKKTIGLTPSEYWKMAKKDRQSTVNSLQ